MYRSARSYSACRMAFCTFIVKYTGKQEFAIRRESGTKCAARMTGEAEQNSGAHVWFEYAHVRGIIDSMEHGPMTNRSQLRLPGIDQRRRVPMRAIRAIANIIAEKFDPEKIVLFGSHAYGHPKPWSDVDLLIVMDAPLGEWPLTEAIRESLPPRSFGLDILVRSQAEIDRRIAIDDWFLEEVMSKGKVLYERDNSGVGTQGRKRLRRRTSG